MLVLLMVVVMSNVNALTPNISLTFCPTIYPTKNSKLPNKTHKPLWWSQKAATTSRATTVASWQQVSVCFALHVILRPRANGRVNISLAPMPINHASTKMCCS
jgi:hypothetical protein